MAASTIEIPAAPSALDAALRGSLQAVAKEAYAAGLRLRAAKRKKTWRKLGFKGWLAYLDSLGTAHTTAYELIEAARWSRAMVEKHGYKKMAAFSTLSKLAGYSPTTLAQLEACRIPVEGGEVAFASATVDQLRDASSLLRGEHAPVPARGSPRLRVKAELQACVGALIRPNQVQAKSGPLGLRIRVRDVPADKARRVFELLSQKVAELMAQGLRFAPPKEEEVKP